jgi:hypothetical protein
MPLDKTKSYGTVHGHEWAKYIQNGTMYNEAGESYDEQSTDREEISEFRKTPETIVQNAREFLTEILAEGPMNRSEIVKEADKRGLDWNLVKSAAVEISVNSYKIRDNTFWRLKIE